MSKKFLFISYDGLISDIAWRVSTEGNEVRYHISNPEEKDIGDGFVPKVDEWEPHVDWADIVVFDDVLGHGEMAEKLRKEGKSVVGGTAYTDRLEDDRTFGQEELKKHGVVDHSVPGVHGFRFRDRCMSRSNPATYVIKPTGEAQNIKRLLFVGEEDDGKDVVQSSAPTSGLLGPRIKVFQLQRRMSGVEIAVGAFFNGHEFMMPINVNFEHKPLFPGNIGPATGEMGTSCTGAARTRYSPRHSRNSKRSCATNAMSATSTSTASSTANGIYPLEFTARFGYPTICIQEEGMTTPVSELLPTWREDHFKIKTRGLPDRAPHRRAAVPVRRPRRPSKRHSKDALIIFQKPVRRRAHRGRQAA